MNGPANNEMDSLDDTQVEMVRGNMQRLTDAELIRSYGIYLRGCEMKNGRAPKRTMLQFFGEAWRELRRRDRLKPEE
jgi:hypothetical protein